MFYRREKTIRESLDEIEKAVKDCRREMDNVDIAGEARNGGSGVHSCLDDIDSYIKDARDALTRAKEATG
jgi:Holliday junction resolvase RusA-like endonuclease